jgi:LacI family transcriptional regulator
LKATIKDVARLADVSISTVSRVINNNYPVSDAVRERILNAIEELGYHPNNVARSLKINKTNLIGLVVADIANPFFMSMAKGIESIITRYSYHILVCSTDENETNEVNILNMLCEKNVDAVVLSSCTNKNEHINKLIEDNCTFVLADRKIEGIKADTVLNDNFWDSYKLTAHLIRNGHNKIGILNCLLSNSTGLDRYNGFKKAMKDFNVPIVEDWVLHGNSNSEDAFQEIKKLIDRNSSLPTAFFSANNLMTEGILLAFQTYGRKVPEDISIVSYGQVSNYELIRPKITCVKQAPFLMGQKIGQLLIEKFDSDTSSLSNKEVIIMSEFIEGDSVKSI